MSPIYCIVTTNKTNNTSHINAVSINKTVVDYMMCTHPDDTRREQMRVIDNPLCYTLCPSPLGELMLMKLNAIYQCITNSRIYAFNKHTTHGIQPALLYLDDMDNIDEIRQLKMFHNNLSQNPVQFDEFYEDGIMTV
jgi:hypothetical protein